MAIQKLIKVNPYTRPGTKNVKIRGIVFHYTANPGAGADNHFRYFNGTAITAKRYAGAHYFVDKTETIQIIPDNEIAYHANEKSCKIQRLKVKIGNYQADANGSTLGIEMCIEKDGSIHPNTYKQTIKLAALLSRKYGLTVNEFYCHYDITSKRCPLPWVTDTSKWMKFKVDVNLELNNIVSKPSTPPLNSGSSVSVVKTGFVKITTPSLNVRTGPTFTSPIAQTVKSGSFYKVYSEKNGMFNIGGDLWISANSKYSKFFKSGTQIGVVTIKKWKPSNDVLNVRDKPALNGKVLKSLSQGTGWKVYDYTNDWLNVGGNQWISRNSKYVSVKFG